MKGIHCLQIYPRESIVGMKHTPSYPSVAPYVCECISATFVVSLVGIAGVCTSRAVICM